SASWFWANCDFDTAIVPGREAFHADGRPKPSNQAVFSGLVIAFLRRGAGTRTGAASAASRGATDAGAGTPASPAPHIPIIAALPEPVSGGTLTAVDLVSRGTAITK
ncbi:MAG TPA: hypothetical protein VN786_01965, partial [Acidimicrobiales bacterium]|nr:hypothetical protein [Acidimicrobiales bacterium]